MKLLYLTSVLLFLSLSVAGINGTLDRVSYKDLKKALKSDSSGQNNSRLAKKVTERGVTFAYTTKRDVELRKLGANDELITAIWQSIVDEREEDKLFREFMITFDSKEKDTRNRAWETGKVYLSRFSENMRFVKNTDRIRKEIRFLECEFDPSLGC